MDNLVLNPRDMSESHAADLGSHAIHDAGPSPTGCTLKKENVMSLKTSPDLIFENGNSTTLVEERCCMKRPAFRFRPPNLNRL